MRRYDSRDLKRRFQRLKKRDPLTERIIACCFKVHSELGPGCNEKIYHNALKLTLKDADLECQTEKNKTDTIYLAYQAKTTDETQRRNR